jgi:hypothetical protein
MAKSQWVDVTKPTKVKTTDNWVDVTKPIETKPVQQDNWVDIEDKKEPEKSGFGPRLTESAKSVVTGPMHMATDLPSMLKEAGSRFKNLGSLALHGKFGEAYDKLKEYNAEPDVNYLDRPIQFFGADVPQLKEDARQGKLGSVIGGTVVPALTMGLSAYHGIKGEEKVAGTSKPKLVNYAGQSLDPELPPQLKIGDIDNGNPSASISKSIASIPKSPVRFESKPQDLTESIKPIKIGPDSISVKEAKNLDRYDKPIYPIETKPKVTAQPARNTLDPDFHVVVQNWIKNDQALPLIGQKIRESFAGLKDVTDIPKFQAEMKAGQHPEVSKFFSDYYDKLKKAKVRFEAKDNYLPQIWEDDPKEVTAKLSGNKRLSISAPFTLESTFKNYSEGIKAGLTPKFTPVQLMEWYGKRAEKLINDKGTFDTLRKLGYIKRASVNLPEGWKTLDPNALPGALRINKKITTPNWAMNAEGAKIIENYLKNPEGVSSSVAKASGKMTAVSMSSGVPNVPLLTAHGTNIASRAFLEGGFKRLGQAINYGLRPDASAKFFNAHIDTAIEGAKKYGVTFGVENPNAQLSSIFEKNTGVRGLINKGVDIQHHYFEKPLFEKFIPTMKLISFDENMKNFRAKGMSEAEAGAAAAKITNNFYGGINRDLLYRNKGITNATRAVLFAPDWLETSKNLGVEIPKALGKAILQKGTPENMAYMKAAGRVAAAYTAASVLQKAMTGKYLHENPNGQQFNLNLGESNGKTRAVKLFGTAADFVRLPLQIMKDGIENKSLEKLPSTIAGKFSLPMQAAADVYNGEDYMGRPNIFKSKDNFGRPIPVGKRLGNTAAQGANLVLPQFGKNMVDYLHGDSGAEEAILGTLESPLVYSGKKKAKNMFDFRK